MASRSRSAVGVEVRRADLSEGDEIGRLTEEVYRLGGFTTDDYSRQLLDGASRVRQPDRDWDVEVFTLLVYTLSL